MSNLDRDLAEMRRLGYTSYGKYKLDYPNTKTEAQGLEEAPQETEVEEPEVGIIDYICKHCCKPFESSRAGKQFCSKQCCRAFSKKQYRERQRVNKMPLMAKCPECGKEFYKVGNSKYCGNECSAIAARRCKREYDRKRRGRKE